MVFEETLNHIHEIQVKVNIGESGFAEIGGRKSGVTIVKKESNSAFEGHSFFRFFGPTSNSTRRTHAKVDNGKCHVQKLIVFLLF